MDFDVKMRECYAENAKNGTFGLSEKFCGLLFDGIMCWPATKAGVLAVQPCPGKHTTQNATKQCVDSGVWFVHKQYNKTWTNYSECWTFYDQESAVVDIGISLDDYDLYKTWFPIIKIISQTGFWISLFFLAVSFTIFASIKRLQCARNKLHMHLIFSFIMRAVMFLIKEHLFVEGIAFSSDLVIVDGKLEYIKEHYNWICKAVTSARNYFIVANYMLILMEGLYLHNLMFLTLFSNNGHIFVYCALGWGLPIVLVVPWIILRAKYEDTLCWTMSDIYYTALLQIPIAISVFINFVLFVIILRVLCGKINSMNIQERKIRYRRLTRSTLFLVLLLGVPYTISLLVSYGTNRTLEVIWIFCDQTFTAFQGFIVALVYCLLNAEVQAEIKHKYRLLKFGRRNRRSRTISHTQQFTIPLNEEISPQDLPKSPVHWQRGTDNLY